jgi:hypothetical protein
MVLTVSVECGKYLKAERGTLTLADGQLRFETGAGVVFDVPLSSIQTVVWHWYSFSAAFEATISGQHYFLSFVPRGVNLGVWYSGISTGRRWRAAMEGKPAPAGPPLAARVFIVFYQVVMIFVLACFALLALGAAIEPASSVFVRILSGVSAALLGLYCIVLTGQGIKAIARALRRKK